MLPAVLTAALFATSVILGHRAARLAGSLEANFWRVILATIFSFGLGLGGGVVGWFALSGAIGVGLGDFAIYHALPLLGPRITSLFVQCFMAVFAALFEWVWLGTTFTWQQGLLSATILAGVLTALGTPGEIREHARTLWPGIVLAVLGAAATAGGAVVSRKAYARIPAHDWRAGSFDVALSRAANAPAPARSGRRAASVRHRHPRSAQGVAVDRGQQPDGPDAGSELHAMGAGHDSCRPSAGGHGHNPHSSHPAGPHL
jgi:hypothetical protein